MHLSGYLDLKNIDYKIKNGSVFVERYLDLRNTAITVLPDNLTVGGYLDLRNTAIKNITFCENCGSEGRTIYAYKNKGVIKILAGCFNDTLENFKIAVNKKYQGKAALDYIAKAEDCVRRLK